MVKIFRNDRKLIRWQDYNYRNAGMYFVTICTKNKEHFLGSIDQGIMMPSMVGQFAITSWLNTPAVRPDMNITLDEFIVMPNHFHALIVIGENRFNSNNSGVHVGNNIWPDKGTAPQNQFGPQSKNLAAIIKGFKTSVTGYANQTDIRFAWQARYHDHVVRDYESYTKIAGYIVENPKNWIHDSLFSRM